LLPTVGALCGGDITLGVLSTGMHIEEAVTLFIDIGTNGEMVLAFGMAHHLRMFGGSRLLRVRVPRPEPVPSSGYRGRVDRPADSGATWSTLGDAPPVGICGSGMISL